MARAPTSRYVPASTRILRRRIPRLKLPKLLDLSDIFEDVGRARDKNKGEHERGDGRRGAKVAGQEGSIVNGDGYHVRGVGRTALGQYPRNRKILERVDCGQKDRHHRNRP